MCHLPQITDMFVFGSDPLAMEICLQQQTRLFLQYKCQQDVVHVEAKQSDSMFVALVEVMSVVVLVMALWYNLTKTNKMD